MVGAAVPGGGKWPPGPSWGLEPGVSKPAMNNPNTFGLIQS